MEWWGDGSIIIVIIQAFVISRNNYHMDTNNYCSFVKINDVVRAV